MIKKSAKIFLLSLVPLIAAAMTMGGRSAWDRWHGSIPRLGCPRTLDLGERERGEIAIGRFQIQNLGRGTLTANDFSTSCSCAGVEREVDGRLLYVKSIHLLPGEKCDLLVRVGINARPGDEQLVHVFFATNDPDHPRWRMDVIISRVGGGYIAEPSAVVFGTFPPGKRPFRIINLYDNGKSGRTVEEVRCTHPKHFSAVLLPLSEEDKPQVELSLGKHFARIKVTAHSELPGPIDGEIQISLKDEKHAALPIPVLGEVVSLAEPRPSMVVLPRYVGNQSVRKGEVLIFNRHEKPIEVAVISLPPEITAELRNIPGHPDQRWLNIEWHPDAKQKQKPMSEVRIRLRVHSESGETDLEVPVFLTEGRSS